MSSSVTTALRAQRLRRGLSQAEVAARTGTSQPAIARLEGGGADPRLGTAQRYAEAVGLDLVALPCAGITLATTSAGIADALAHHSPDTALRHVLQLLDDLRGLDAQAVRGVLRTEPDRTGSARWDALLAAACERAAHRAGVPAPGWTSAPSRFLDHLWAPVGDILGRLPGGLAAMLLACSPPEFAIRGVLIDPATLDSV